MSECNICGNTTFTFGPGKRVSLNGKMPRCAKCRSLERHRIFRNVINEHYSDDWFYKKVLQFSSDLVIDPEKFKDVELSIYEGNNSLDICNINRPDGCYDIIVCNHVLEHVKDDVKAVNELIRIIKRNGYIFLSVPNPVYFDKTDDWGYPKESDSGHYRTYGRDFLKKLKSILYRKAIVSEWVGIDPVTEIKDIMYVIKKL